MHVLVTGSTGFVGFHTVLALLEAGHTVCFGARSKRKLEGIYTPLGIDTSSRSICDITDSDGIASAIAGCDAVAHTAALVSLKAEDAELVYHTNTVGTELVVGGALKKGLPVIAVSSITALYDRNLAVIDENAPLGSAETGYGKSKVDSDKWMREQQSQGKRVAITYPTGIVGPDDPALSDSNEALALFCKLGALRTTGGSNYIDVRDLAKAHVALLEAHATGPYVVAGHYLDYNEFAELLKDIPQAAARSFYVPGWLLRAMGGAADALRKVITIDSPISREAMLYATCMMRASDEKLRKETGLSWRPFNETLKETVDWLESAGHIQ